MVRVEALKWAVGAQETEGKSSNSQVSGGGGHSLCNNSAQAFALSAYDNGRRGETFQTWGVDLCPKVSLAL